MKPEINFYLSDETLAKSCAPLLLKILDEKKRAFLFCQENKMQELDSGLWTYGRNKFIPHATINNKDFIPENQPILLSNKEENKNNSTYLVLFDQTSDQFISKFSRIFYFFESAKEAENLASKFRPLASQFNFYQKEDGKWKALNKN